SKHEPRYYFMTFNASVLYFQTVRPLLQPGRCRHLVPSLRQVVGSLEEVADRDHSWRAELMMHLIKCLVDSREMEEAARFAKVTEEFIKSHIPHLYPRLFTLLYILALTARVVLSLLQERHSQTEVVIPQARLKEIGQLDQCLQTAVREGDPQAAQAVCATQWRFCLPLLQHNLRTHIRTPLLRVAQVLEDIQSMLLETRCQVHSELAVIEEEDGRLEASLTHLQKAMLLDDGTRQERLSSALRLLQLRGTLYQTPPRAEDKADLLMQTDSRPILVAVGLLLAPDDFQMVLDADNTSKSSLGSGPGARLSAKAQHHSTSVRKLDGHLARQGKDTDITERAKLWATLVKTARKQEVWDVCRAACRFCLLYDDGRLKISETDGKMMNDGKNRLLENDRNQRDGTEVAVVVLVIHTRRRVFSMKVFCSVKATVQKLLTEGVQLNGPVVPAVKSELCASEEDPHWVVYRDWVQALSAYATSNLLRAAELGARIKEPWVVANAAIYLWNYSGHLLAAGEYQRLLPTFQSLVAMLQTTENCTLFLLLCDAVARGLIQPLCGPDSLCDYALRISTCNTPGEAVPIAARKQAVATWVRVKRLLQQEIGSKMETKDECENEEVSAMTRVLVAVEMLQCNRNPRHKEFSVPGLSSLVSMASECSWTDAVVELQVWCQLAACCHHAKDHRLVLCCTESALQLEEAATKSLNAMPRLTLVRESKKAESPALCVAAARHYWNTCLPLTQTPEERWHAKNERCNKGSQQHKVCPSAEMLQPQHQTSLSRHFQFVVMPAADRTSSAKNKYQHQKE
uniref:Cilia and flagella associated protein 46 n=1 Tax=Cyclopterus lumpus TaxID=8103 RepID=A0A8C3AX50_CYCLU